MEISNSVSCFDEQMERIKLITGKRTQLELADLLGVKQSSVSDAKRRGKIPSGWLVMLMRYKHANPDWVLTGSGPVFVSFPPVEPHYETGDAAAERKADEEALRRLSPRMLTEELLRRIAISQYEADCSKAEK